MKIEEEKVKDIKFEGRGCAISQASASMLTEMIMDKPLTTVKDLTKEDILENIGLMNLGPARIKCALLSLKYSNWAWLDIMPIKTHHQQKD